MPEGPPPSDAPAASPPAPFRDRGKDISRLEGFSDCAFGFAITLLVVSLDVPSRFSALLDLMGSSRQDRRSEASAGSGLAP
jgi:hypothetical protein